jgi:hypothetical protein
LWGGFIGTSGSKSLLRSHALQVRLGGCRSATHTPAPNCPICVSEGPRAIQSPVSGGAGRGKLGGTDRGTANCHRRCQSLHSFLPLVPTYVCMKGGGAGWERHMSKDRKGEFYVPCSHERWLVRFVWARTISLPLILSKSSHFSFSAAIRALPK